MSFAYWRFFMVDPVVVCSLFLRCSYVLFLGSPLRPGVAKCSQRGFGFFFSGHRVSELFLSAYLGLGSIFWSAYLLSRSCIHMAQAWVSYFSQEPFFYIHVPVPRCIYPTTSQTIPLCVCHSFLKFNFPKLSSPKKTSPAFSISPNSTGLPCMVV